MGNSFNEPMVNRPLTCYDVYHRNTAHQGRYVAVSQISCARVAFSPMEDATIILGFDVTLGNLAVHLAQFLEETVIGGGIDDFHFNCCLLCPQTLELQLKCALRSL